MCDFYYGLCVGAVTSPIVMAWGLFIREWWNDRQSGDESRSGSPFRVTDEEKEIMKKYFPQALEEWQKELELMEKEVQ